MTMCKEKQYERSVESAITVLQYLNVRTPTTTLDLSLATGYSASTIDKTIRVLKSKKWISAKRGPGGGYFRNKPLEDIKMGEFLDSVPETRWAFSISLSILSEMSLREFLAKSM